MNIQIFIEGSWNKSETQEFVTWLEEQMENARIRDAHWNGRQIKLKEEKR